MSMIMNHDMASIMSQRAMQRNSLAMKRSLEKLSTGLRTSISDGHSASLAISETLRSHIGGMERALNNSQDGISLIQTATGALDQTQQMLTRMRELSLQAANDALTMQDRSYIQVEINELRGEITHIADTTQFNRKNILSGDSAVLWSSSDSGVKAIINGGIRSTDDYGQKYALDGNYKINARVEAGKAQVQKSDVFRIKHDSTAENKVLNTDAGVADVSVNGAPEGSYTITLAEDAEMSSEGVMSSSYGIGGRVNSTDSEIAFADIGSPVTKITVSTTDGYELWSVRGSDLLHNSTAGGGVTTAADQAAFFNGRSDTENGPRFEGVKNEIIAAAREKGITLSGFGDVDSEDDNLTLNARSVNGTAPGIKITYETEAHGVDPVSTITVNDSENIAASDVFRVEVTDANVENASVLFEVKDIDEVNGEVVLKATALKLSQDGVSSSSTQDNITLSMGTDGETPNTINLSELFGGTDDEPAVTISLNEDYGLTPIAKGAKFVYTLKAGAEEANNENAIELDINDTGYILNGASTANKELKFNQFFMDDGGAVSQGTITLDTRAAFRSEDAGGTLNPDNPMLASFDVGYVGQTATSSTKLRDIDKFWDSEGIYILSQPKELTLTQGDGRQAKVMLYGEDTVADMTRKLNDAIANGLGQGKYVDDTGNFVTFVDGATSGLEAVEGTLVIRSVLAGAKGEIAISGGDDFLNALSLNTIQASKENVYTVDVTDAHDGAVLADSFQTTGSVLKGVIHQNVDVELDSMYGLSVSWDDTAKSFVLDDSAPDNGSDVILHLADNTMIFQTGGTEGDDVMVSIGNMSSHALGLDAVNVMSRERAMNSLALIDTAIDKVTMQQVKLGSAQIRLEHHIDGLSGMTQGLVLGDSNITDIDYAAEMMEYVKNSVIMQSNTAMLAQAGQIQSSTLLTLLRA